MNVELQLQAGGTLNSRRHLYIERQEDEKFFQLLEQAEYVNVLSSRQMGKSSLMMRAVQRLGERGIRTVTIDLASELGTPPDLDAFYLGLLSKVVRALALPLDLQTWWHECGAETVNQRLLRFFREVVGGTVVAPVVIFLDEIDSTLKLPYTDDLFTAIRGMYNDRPMVEAYRRIAFCLLGVATPNELIKDRRTTAYNVGVALTLRDFDRDVDDLSPLAAVLNSDAAIADRLLDRILYWSGGQPYLTQKLCADVVAKRIADADAVDDLVRHVYDNLGQASNDVHFQQILRFLEDRLSDESATIRLYTRILNGKTVPDRTRLASAELKLSGLVKRDNQGNLVVRNPIYRRLFDVVWVRRTGPGRALQRARLLTAAVSIAFVALFAGTATYYVGVVRPAQIRLRALDHLAALKISVTDASGGAKVVFPDGATIQTIREAIPSLKTIRVTEIDSPADSRVAPSGKKGFSGELDDLSLFAELDGLRSLDLTDLKVKSLGRLDGLGQLRVLGLGSNSVRGARFEKLPLADIAPVAGLKYLQRLSISATSVSDLGPLSSLQGLKELDVSGSNAVDLRPVQDLKQLSSLNASFTRVQDLDPLSGLESLETLILIGTPVSDISPLSHLSHMSILNLASTNVTNIAPLSGLTNLHGLDLDVTGVVDLSPIAALSALTNLGTRSTRVADLRPLGRLTNLEGLDLGQTKVRDLSPLKNLTMLRILFLGDTDVSDAGPLMNLTNLEFLDLERTKIPRQQLAALRQHLDAKVILSDAPDIDASKLK